MDRGDDGRRLTAGAADDGVTDKPGITLACCGLLGTLVADDGLIERSFAEAIATQGVVSGTSAFARRMAQVHQARGQAPGDVLCGRCSPTTRRARRPPSWPSTGRLAGRASAGP